jgi:K+-transporting ATPase ATPase C chain
MKENVFGSLRLFLALTVLLGLGYPALVWAIGRVTFRDKADGSLVPKDNVTVGSSLIGQSFVMPGHFHGRPSAAGNGYDPTSTGGSNLGPTSKKLADSIKDAVTSVRSDEGVTTSVPADAVTSSGSGVDPHISRSTRVCRSPASLERPGLPPPISRRSSPGTPAGDSSASTANVR